MQIVPEDICTYHFLVRRCPERYYRSGISHTFTNLQLVLGSFRMAQDIVRFDRWNSHAICRCRSIGHLGRIPRRWR